MTTPTIFRAERLKCWVGAALVALLFIAAVGYTGLRLAPQILSQGAAMPANEAQARQFIANFYQRSLQDLPHDWYWSTSEPGGYDFGDAASLKLGGTTFSFSANFWLRGDILDTAHVPADAAPMFYRVVVDWERLGWKKNTEKNPESGMRYINGTTPDGLECDLQISKQGSIGTRCNVHFHASDYDDSLHFPRLITRDGPAPWTPPTTSTRATPTR